MRLAYLCNVYPAVSHSFVRREIEGVERAGHVVHRFSLRPAAANLRDPADQREAERTESILKQGAARLLLAASILSLSRPSRTLSALAMAWRLSAPGFNSRFRHLAYWLEAAWLVRRLKELRVEHLHAHFGTNPAAVAAIGRAWGGVEFSFTTHGPNEFDSPLQLSLPEKIAAAKFVAGISNFGRSQLMRWANPGEWGKIKIVRCGLGADYLSAPLEPISAASTEFVSVARLSPAKGLPLLIAASARLRDAGEKLSLTIIGDGELRSSLEQQIRRENLSNHVRLVGIRSSEEIREHLKSARAFVLPSFAEGLPVVIMEALALGRPVITTAITGIPELVDDQCGWLITPASEEALMEAMLKALRSSSNELDRMGSVGRDRVKRMHNADTNARILMEAVQTDKRTEAIASR